MMCGRFALFATEDEIRQHFSLRAGLSMRSRYNIAPTQTIPMILKGTYQIDFARWGFIPPWVKSLDIPPGHINARLESLEEKASFRQSFRQQRCLIPASGYYEWKTLLGKKQPYFITLKTQPLIAFAGIWSSWHSPQGVIRSCAIVTTGAQGSLQEFHERMPAIVRVQDYSRWLFEKDPALLKQLFLDPLPHPLEISSVTWRMNNPRFEGKECIQAL